MYTLSTQMKYNANNVTTVYTPIVGIDVKKLIAFVNADLAQFVKFPKNQVKTVEWLTLCCLVFLNFQNQLKLLDSVLVDILFQNIRLNL